MVRCTHSTLLALLYDGTLQMPDDCSSRQLQGRAGRSKRPTAWAEIHEEEDETPRTQRWAPRQMSATDMVISWRKPVRLLHLLPYLPPNSPNEQGTEEEDESAMDRDTSDVGAAAGSRLTTAATSEV